ncbi:hypothetical protein BH11MYX2_BH11MYX2_19330 [soil metagenome]
MKRLFAVALIVAAASACTGKGGTGRNSGLTRQYDPQTYQTSHGDLDRAIGQR